ncbi:terminase small subunit [Vibrio phage 1.232.O._10N.261.51.E11]|nr:terminase small subunit [Vibrio phage 1.232.O._10N.261.51.E11]
MKDVKEFGLTDSQKELFEKLTPLQKKIATHTIEGLKPAEAHKAAGGKCKDESRRKDLGSQILSNPVVKQFLDSIIKPQEDKALSGAIMSRQEALERLTSIALTNPEDLTEGDTAPTVAQHNQIRNMNMTAIKQIAEMMAYNREADAETAVLTQEERILNMTKNHAVTDEKLN